MSLWFLALMFFSEGLLLVGISIPLINRRIKPNPWYGFRTSKTLFSVDIWYPANEYAGRMLRKAGFGVCAISIMLFKIKPGIDPITYICIVVGTMMTLLLIAVIKSFIYLSRF